MDLQTAAGFAAVLWALYTATRGNRMYLPTSRLEAERQGRCFRCGRSGHTERVCRHVTRAMSQSRPAPAIWSDED